MRTLRPARPLPEGVPSPAELARPRPGRALALARARMLRHRARAVRRRCRRSVGRLAVLAALGLGFGGLVLASALAVFDGATSPEDAAAMLACVFAVVAVGGFIGGVGAALQSLYLGGDLPLLLSLPIPLRVAYASKFADALAGTLPVAAVAGLGVLGFVATQPRSGLERWALLPTAAVVTLALLVGTTSLAVALVAGIARLLPPRRARLFLGLVSLALVAALWAAWSAVLPDSGAGGPAGGSDRLGRDMVEVGDGLAATPLGWGARAIVAAARGDLGATRDFGGLFLATAAAAILTGYGVFAGTFERGSAGIRAAALATPRLQRPLARWAARGLAELPAAVASLVMKEWLTLFRDLRRLSGAVWPMGMVLIYTVVLSRNAGSAPAGAPGLAFWQGAGALALLPWGASLGLSIYAVGTEGRGIHLLRSLPLAPRTVLLAKALAYFVPVLLATEAAAVVVASVQRASAGQLLGLMGLVAWAAAGYVLVDVSAAAVAPNFDAEHVGRATALPGRAFGFAAGALFSVLSGVAAVRLVLYSTGAPDAVGGALAWEAAGVRPLGWPLVAAGTLGALLVVAGAFRLAEASLGAIFAGED